MTRSRARKYDDEFKNNAVSLYLSGDRSYQQLGEELGISHSTLAGWVNSGKYHNNGNNGSRRKITEAELSEFKKLRKELAHVKMERDILKKAVAIFTKPTK